MLVSKAAILHLECQVQHCFSDFFCLSALLGLGGNENRSDCILRYILPHVMCIFQCVDIVQFVSELHAWTLTLPSCVTALFSDKGILTVQFWLQECGR